MKIKNEKAKQIILSCIAILLMIIGYMNYSYDNEKDEVDFAARDNDINLGDVQLVNSEPEFESNIVPNEMIENAIVDNTIIDNENELKENNIIENIKEEENYFTETKLERERMYSEMIETYQNIISNTMTPEDQKAIAAQEISNITNSKNKIMIAENLIKNKGFENVVVLVNNGNISVVVKSRNLNTEQVSKIQNIIQREFEVDVQNINISNK